MAGPTATPPIGRVEPKSQHVADGSLQPFLQQDFDPADYLNTSLPTLSASTSTRNVQTRAVPLPELSSQLQSLLAQLNAQTTRLSSTLNQLTDEIVRSGSRLAYEVEVLHGETTGLTDSLENGLKKDIERFVPQGGQKEDSKGSEVDSIETTTISVAGKQAEPEYLAQLRTLTEVRSRLDSVMKVFGDAMAWPLAPSELAGVTSSLISVSAPESDAESRDREEKGKEYIEKLRSDITEVVGAGSDQANVDAALSRIEELRALAEVWKGTAEEKARLKLIESLQKPVEERQRALERAGQPIRKPGTSPSRGADMRYGNMDTRGISEGGYGFLQNLRNLKNDLYVE
ncbi:hypothetical protein EJ03DRAFT_183728 [Teratosphaeria nubilosa]|uniref:Uncharacterized protein n=1 Tax=Teratosphaeria nubilosa TaxID=161662 RepID=A0A6G1L0N1_9PEZI|nr:hypothetical protein EJ03DRAFT_183728 [Teratosphaeria nubilosa]